MAVQAAINVRPVCVFSRFLCALHFEVKHSIATGTCTPEQKKLRTQDSEAVGSCILGTEVVINWVLRKLFILTRLLARVLDLGGGQAADFNTNLI